MERRQGDSFYHLGDLTLRVRQVGSSDWQDLSTAAARKPVTALPISGHFLASADLAPTLPTDCPLQIVRCCVSG